MSLTRAPRGLQRSTPAAAMTPVDFHPDLLTWCLFVVVTATIGSSAWLARR